MATKPDIPSSAPPPCVELLYSWDEGDPSIFTLVSPKGAPSVTYPFGSRTLSAAESEFAHQIFDISGHRCHGYEGRPKGDVGPSGHGWTGIWLRVDKSGVWSSEENGTSHVGENGASQNGLPPAADGAAVTDASDCEVKRAYSMEVVKEPMIPFKEALVITATDDVSP